MCILSGRVREGLAAVKQSGIQIDWFESPHYAASVNQRAILESWFGLHFEPSPRDWGAKQAKLEDRDSPLYRGAIYVPTPLDYFDTTRPIESELQRLRNGGEWQVALSSGKSFVPAGSKFKALVNWAKGTNWVPLVGDFNGDDRDDIAVRNPYDGDLQVAVSDGQQFVMTSGRGDGHWLLNWGVSTDWQPLVGDFDGDKIDDILVVNKQWGDWQVARSTGKQFTPVSGMIAPWAAGPATQPLVGVFTSDGRASIAAHNPGLRNGVIDFAVSVVGRE